VPRFTIDYSTDLTQKLNEVSVPTRKEQLWHTLTSHFTNIRSLKFSHEKLT
jgi:hypothetical protein